MERARAVMTEIGQVPITVKRELDGFILNRLQGALLSEALRLVGEGYVSPQDIDKTIQDGLGLRWSFIGPFATIELNAPGGVADYCARYAGFYRSLAANPPSATIWDTANVQHVASQLEPPPTQAERDARMRWRDLRLLALRQHKRDEPDSVATQTRAGNTPGERKARRRRRVGHPASLCNAAMGVFRSNPKGRAPCTAFST